MYTIQTKYEDIHYNSPKPFTNWYEQEPWKIMQTNFGAVPYPQYIHLNVNLILEVQSVNLTLPEYDKVHKSFYIIYSDM
jgi:hypothetical protein